MEDKFSYLKLKLYLFSSTNAEQRKDQKHMPVKNKKDGSTIGTMTSVYGLTIVRNTYSGKIKPKEFCKRLDQAKKSSKNQLNE